MKSLMLSGLLSGMVTLSLLAAAPASASGVLTFDQVLARVMEKNLEMMAATAAVQASGAREDQAGRWQNPDLDLEWENLAGGGDFGGLGSSELTLLVSQTFELGGKIGRRRDQAEGVSSVVEWEQKTLGQDIILRSEDAFLAVWEAQSLLDLAAEQQNLFGELLAEIQRRVTAGAASSVELSRARVNLTAAEMVGRSRQQQLESACRRLAALWNSTQPDFSRVAADFNTLASTVLPADSADQLAANPELGNWRARVALQQANWDLARAEGALDLNLGFGLKHFNEYGDQALVIGAGVPLPVFNRNQDEARAAEYELDQVRLQGQAVTTALLTEIAVAREEEMIARDEVLSLRDDIIPQATAAFEETLEGHQRGFFTLTDVLETRQFLYELRAANIDALVRHHAAGARLRRLTGMSVPAERISQ